MRKIIFIVIFLPLLFACRKNNTHPKSNDNPSDSNLFPIICPNPLAPAIDYNSFADSVTFDLDGVHSVFQSDITSRILPIPNAGYSEFQVGQTLFYSDSDYIALSFFSPCYDDLEVGTYGNLPADSSSHAFFTFHPKNDSQDFESVQNQATAFPFTITITSVTDSAVTGTFQGPIFLEGQPSSPVKQVTNGKFYVRK